VTAGAWFAMGAFDFWLDCNQPPISEEELWDVQQIGRELKSLRSYLEREFELLRNQSVQERCSAVPRPPLGFVVPDARVPTKDSNPCTHITNTEEAEEDQIDPISPQTSGTVRVSRLQQIFKAYEEKNFSSGWTSESGQGCLKDVVLSSAFSCIMVVLIFINVIILGVEVSVSASLGQEDVPPEFLYANAGFMAFFLLEIGLRILALGCHDFWWGELATWNRFDCVVISLGSVDLAVSFWAEITAASLYARSVRMTHILRVAHALRSVRVVRFFRYRTPLKALVLSIFSTVMPLIWTLVLLLILLYSFSIVLTQLVVDDCRYRTVEATGDPNAIPVCAEHLQRHWSTVPESMNSLFMGITGGIEWDELMRPLRDVSVAAVCSLYVFILIAVFAVLNVLTAHFCNTAIETASADQDVAVVRHLHERHQIVAKFRKLFAEIGASERVTLPELQTAAAGGSEIKVALESLGISTDNVSLLFRLIDRDHNDTLDLEEFVVGCMQLRGNAKGLQLAKMDLDNRIMRHRVKDLREDVASVRKSVQSLERSFHTRFG